MQAPPPDGTPPGGPNRRTLIRDIVLNAGLPYATYLILTQYGVATVPALVSGAIFPVGAIIWSAARERRIQAIGVIVLAATAASVASALWFTSPFLALARGALITSLIAVVFLVSLMARRPLVFHLATAGQASSARRDAEADWDASPVYRGLMRRLTAIWGGGLLTEAALHLALIAALPPAAAIPVTEALFWLFFAGLMAWSWRHGRATMEQIEETPAASA